MELAKLIVIDGLDGSGKSTHLEITQKRLQDMGYNIKTISFPDYNSQSSALVKMYLGGEFSENPDDINAYAASSFYAVDRYASFMTDWKKDYEDENTIILAARYVSSNALHQMSKLQKSQWDSFIEWLYDYEHNKLGLPPADKMIFLDMPVEVSQKLLSHRYNNDESKKDIHEADVDYLRKCRGTALYAANKLGWTVIPCNDKDNPRSIEDISDDIMKAILGKDATCQKQ